VQGRVDYQGGGRLIRAYVRDVWRGLSLARKSKKEKSNEKNETLMEREVPLAKKKGPEELWYMEGKRLTVEALGNAPSARTGDPGKRRYGADIEGALAVHKKIRWRRSSIAEETQKGGG